MPRLTIIFAALLLGLSSMAQTAKPSTKGAPSGFTWGANVGGSIDMSCHNQSSFDLDVNLGYRSPLIRLVGINLGARMMTSDGNRSFPLAAILRTSFTNRPALCFWELQAGAALNYLEHNQSQTGLFMSTGIGFNLAMSHNFQSHIILSYAYYNRRDYQYKEATVDCPSLSKVFLAFGVNF